MPCFQNILSEYKELIIKENKDFISTDDNVFTFYNSPHVNNNQPMVGTAVGISKDGYAGQN